MRVGARGAPCLTHACRTHPSAQNPPFPPMATGRQLALWVLDALQAEAEAQCGEGGRCPIDGLTLLRVMRDYG